ncbi:MAG: hypothetical protein DLM65_15530, partial [Candidatus Aeolococcus gillhamiae]
MAAAVAALAAAGVVGLVVGQQGHAAAASLRVRTPEPLGALAAPGPATSTTVDLTTGVSVNASGTGAGSASLPAGFTSPRLPVPSQNLPPVAALGQLREADAIVRLPASLTEAQKQTLAHTKGLAALEAVDTATLHLGGAPAVTFGVDPGTFRAFTPAKSATEDRLWRYAEAGSLVSSFEMAKDRALALGSNMAIVPAGGRSPTEGWLGAFASLGLPGVDLVVSHDYSALLGLTPNSGLVVSAPQMDPTTLQGILRRALPGADVELLHPGLLLGSSANQYLSPGRVSTILTAALSRVGMPYVWGASGPSAFDCSGLVAWSFAQAGISMPRTAAQQYLTGPHLTLAAAQPGDLLFWANDPTDPTFIDHTAIYLGKGMMVVAPHSGLDVEVVPVTTDGFVGAVSVDPPAASTVGG